MISEKVVRLRKLADQWRHNDVAGCNLIDDAIDTIEALSEKVRNNNLYGGWIRIEDRKPEHYQDVIITHRVNTNEDSDRAVAGVFYDKVNDRFYDQGYGEMSFSDVVAWMPMPTPYDK